MLLGVGLPSAAPLSPLLRPISFEVGVILDKLFSSSSSSTVTCAAGAVSGVHSATPVDTWLMKKPLLLANPAKAFLIQSRRYNCTPSSVQKITGATLVSSKWLPSCCTGQGHRPCQDTPATHHAVFNIIILIDPFSARISGYTGQLTGAVLVKLDTHICMCVVLLRSVRRTLLHCAPAYDATETCSTTLSGLVVHWISAFVHANRTTCSFRSTVLPGYHATCTHTSRAAGKLQLLEASMKVLYCDSAPRVRTPH